MSRLWLSALALMLLSGGAQAQQTTGNFTPEEQEGSYFGSGEGGELTVDLTHKQDDIFAVEINTVVPMENDMPGCAGSIEGEMIMDGSGGNLFVENEDYEPGSDSPMFGEQYCEVKLTFDADGSLNVEEQTGCIAYHGASCEFTGQVLNMKAVN